MEWNQNGNVMENYRQKKLARNKKGNGMEIEWRWNGKK